MHKPADHKIIDLVGKTFGGWRVLSYAGKSSNRMLLWLCRCECGTERVVTGSNLVQGYSMCCGCRGAALASERLTKYGVPKGRPYGIWRRVVERCTNPRFKDYAARGIGVCDEWRNSYEAFYRWAVANGYDDSLSIERKDVNGDYCPGNCEWIPRRLQNRNRRCSVAVTAFGETKTTGHWGDDPRCMVSPATLCRRVQRGWRHEFAVVTPSLPRGKPRPSHALRAVGE